MLKIAVLRAILITFCVFVFNPWSLAFSYYVGIIFAVLALIIIFSVIRHDSPKHAIFMGNEEEIKKSIAYILESQEDNDLKEIID